MAGLNGVTYMYSKKNVITYDGVGRDSDSTLRPPS